MTKPRTANIHRKLAGDKALAAGLKTQVIRQHGKVDDCYAYLNHDIWADAWGEPEPATFTRKASAHLLPPTEPENPLEMKFSLFPHVKNSAATSVTLDKMQFCELFSKHDIRIKKDGKLFAPAAFDKTRSNTTFISADAICIDYDYGQPGIGAALGLFTGTLVVYYSTHSHCWKSKEQKKKNDDGTITVIPADATYTPENPHFRLVIPLERTVNSEEHDRLVKAVISIIPPEQLECIDTSCFEKARSHYLPSCIPEHEQHAFSGFQDGEPLNVKYFLRLASKLEANETAGELCKPVSVEIPVNVNVPLMEIAEPEPIVSRNYEYASNDGGEVIDLVKWAAQNSDFDLVNAIGPQYRRGYLKNGKLHIQCPFENQHTAHIIDRATFVANASPPEHPSFTIYCCHEHCAGRDRLEFIQAMLENGWLSLDQLQPTVALASLSLKRPPYSNYRSQEIAAALVQQPLQPIEFQYLLHLMHIAWSAYDGTLPDDDWTISRILGVSEDQWLTVKTTLIRSGWQVVENGRIFNQIILREYRISQKELMLKTLGGSKGGRVTQQQRKKEREAYLKG